MKKRYLIVPMVALLLTSNVYAITSNDVTYNNDGTTENLTTTLDTLYSELNKYKTGGSVQSNQMLEGATGYSKGELVTGTIKSKAATTYTPGTSNQTIAAGQYLSGAQTIAGDADLKASNILSGVNIFGVTGTHSGLDHTYAVVTERGAVYGDTANYDADISLSGDIDVGVYLVVAGVTKNNGITTDAILNLAPIACGRGVCAGLSVTAIANSIGGNVNVSVYLVRVNAKKNMGENIMRVMSLRGGNVGPYYVTYDWIRIG